LHQLKDRIGSGATPFEGSHRMEIGAWSSYISAVAPGTSSDTLLPAGAVPHRLDPRAIPFGRVVGWIAAILVSVGLLIAALIAGLSSSAPRAAWLAGGAGWILVTAGLARWAHHWPARSYQHSSYLVDDRGIEICTGVYWRKRIAVPQSRVQHIDVSQGPLQRAYGLATLTLFTAGTAYSSVPLSGLAHETALALRDALRPKRADDGV
jgi:membrane protein YdbS with pleckstrin-like domain